ncbi:MAG: T9SS type A sorting domain-containing protein [Bacteroidetes bacterium]|nr:T9SS type A sorting domain-containing protein [Bacteroidota bacterium]
MSIRFFFPFALIIVVSVQYMFAQSTEIFKPHGCFSSSGATQADVLSHPGCRGVLISTLWKTIEPAPGKFDFTILKNSINVVKSYGKKWSLAVASGGTGSPTWLFDSLRVPYVNYSFRGVPGYKLPLFWDNTVQHRLTILAEALGKEFANDTSLALVYVTQMTANGNEGHLNGINMDSMRLAGFTPEKWIASVEYVAKIYASAFPNKALAVEVHEIDNSSEIPKNIINDLWNDASLQHRVGAAMWWVSGKTTYQSTLIQVLKEFQGDIYGQVIGRSDSVSRFGNNDYSTVFSQAKEIRLRYIELWEWEYKNHTYDYLLKDFNSWVDSIYNISTSVEAHSQLLQFSLSQNYPNPFNPETTIEYQLSEPDYVKIKIYDVKGELINSVDEGYKPSGNHQITWSGLNKIGTKAASGAYFYQLEASNRSEVKKMLLLK